MRIAPLLLGLALVADNGSAFASTHPDFTRSFPLQTLKTFEFKDQRRISRDPLANNDIWANDIRQAIRGGWPPAYDAWAVPYTESTVIVDVIDARTNQLVWRGYDTDTLNMSKPDKTLTKAVDNVVSRFSHDTKEAHEHVG